MKENLLIVDDEPLILELVKSKLSRHGYKVFCARNGKDALRIFENEKIDLALLDYSLPDLCGADLFRQLRALHANLPVIFLTGHANLETAVELMKSGVRDYLTKPFCLEELTAQIQTVLQTSCLTSGNPTCGNKPDSNTWLPGGYIFGDSEAMRPVDAQIRNLPRYPDTTVLISGPTGTGKSVVARRIHELTWGKNAPFVEIDCSTIPRELCESELFGHEKGSFTGAHSAKLGLFEAAAKGTAFLDEIGELEPPLQVKFLRVLEARQFKRVGGTATIPMTARVIAATNRPLLDLVRTGRFREDLYFRLNVLELWMPPLKDRGEDVITLAGSFLDYFANRYQKAITGFTEEAISYLRTCEFPGNVRELRNMIERAVISTNASQIHFVHLVSLQRQSLQLHTPAAEPLPPLPPQPIETATEPGEPTPLANGNLNLAELEREKLLEAFKAANGNKSKAAAMVGLSRTAFHRRLLKYQGPAESQ